MLSTNLKFLRKQKGITQVDLSSHLGLTRSLVGAYEEGRAEPKLSTLQLLSTYFNVSIDALVSESLSGDQSSRQSGKDLRILSIVSGEEKEKTTIVPVKASAGYSAGYGDIDFIESLSAFSIPFPELPQDRTYRVFQIQGDSMLPVKSGSYIIGEYVQDWTQLRDGECYVFVTREEGVVYKRVLNRLDEGYAVMQSDNDLFKDYELKVGQIVEVWSAKGVVSFDLPSKDEVVSTDVLAELKAIKKEISLLSKK